MGAELPYIKRCERETFFSAFPGPFSGRIPALRTANCARVEVRIFLGENSPHTCSVNPLAQTAPPSERPPIASPAVRFAWWQAAVLLLLIGWLYAGILSGLFKQWVSDPNFSHGFFVPAFSLLVLWQSRSRLTTLPRKPSSWGLLILVLGL